MPKRIRGLRRVTAGVPGITGPTVSAILALQNCQKHQKLGSASEVCGKVKPVAPPNLH